MTGLLLYGMVRGQREVQRAALAGFLLLAVLTIPVYLTGEPAEDAIERVPGVARALIDRHETLATVAMGLTAGLGIVAALGMFFSRHNRPVPRLVLTGGVLVAVLAIGALIPTGYFGGQIRHEEIRAARAPMQGVEVEELPGR
ncbi:MAG TPA: hypothetical protein VFP39_07950 [Gemmatimonadales bacterium]|nr:hypothetical protein [Gemmatimonadales bacterium]